MHVSTAFDITGRKVLITGAGRGIGRAIGEVLAEAGADVVLNARTSRYVIDAAHQIGVASGRSVVPVLGDLTSAQGAAAVVAEAIDRLGHIDVLINNLGDSLHRGPLAAVEGFEGATQTPATIDAVIAVNLRSAIYCAQAAGPHLIGRGSGKVINLSSFVAVSAGIGIVAQCASKAGIEGFTRSLALEWAPHGIQVNAISPGFFPDAIGHDEDAMQRIAELAPRIPLGRTGDPREVGYLARYLASPAADYVTGQTIHVDGGWTAL